MEVRRKKSNVALLSIISNSVLILLKLIVGIMIGSVAVISEAIHSGIDLLAAIIAFFAVRISGKPADKDHPFGHGKFENISGTVEAFLIFIAAAWIVYEAVKRLLYPVPLENTAWGIAVMLFSAVVNLIVSHRLFKVGKETDSIALQADGWHLRTDVYTSVGVMFGLGVIYLGKYIFPQANLHWIDPFAALAVALLIGKAAFHLTMKSAGDLLDISLPESEKEIIRDIITGHKGKVFGFHDLRTRKAGSSRFVEFHLIVNSKMTVDDSHNIAETITSEIKKHLSECTVTVHVEPCNDKCSSKCLSGCLIKK